MSAFIPSSEAAATKSLGKISHHLRHCCTQLRHLQVISLAGSRLIGDGGGSRCETVKHLHRLARYLSPSRPRGKSIIAGDEPYCP